MWYFTGVLDEGEVSFRWLRQVYVICQVDYTRYILQDSQKRLYYSGIKLKASKIKLCNAGIMVQFLFGMELYNDKCVTNNKTNYPSYYNVLTSLLL